MKKANYKNKEDKGGFFKLSKIPSGNAINCFQDEAMSPLREYGDTSIDVDGESLRRKSANTQNDFDGMFASSFEFSK